MTELLVQDTNQIRYLTLNRPEKRNALSIPLITLLQKAFKFDTKQIRAVVLSGNGMTFCAGADLSLFTGKDAKKNTATFFSALAKLLITIRECPVPVLCNAHGAIYAGGVGLAAAADIVTMTAECTFSLSESKLGFAPLTILPLLQEKLPHNTLSALALGLKPLTFEEAVRIGFATPAPLSSFDATIQTLSTSALSIIKKALLSPSQKRQILSNAKKAAKLVQSKEAQLRIAAFFAQKRGA